MLILKKLMLLSIVSGLGESRSNKETVLKKFTSLCQLLSSLKYDGIELSILEPERIDVNKIVEIKDSYSLDISALGTGSTYIRFGYSLGDSNEQIRKKAIEQMEKYVVFANKTNAKVIIGLIRGRYKHDNNPKKEKLNIKNSIKECCRIAEDYDVTLVFEPINRFEIDSYNTISEALELLKEINHDNLKLLIDSFHVYLEEDPVYIWDYLEEIATEVGHIHLADTNRRAPGSGHFDFKAFLNIFKKVGYKDYVSIETIMKPSFEEVAKNSREYLDFIL